MKLIIVRHGQTVENAMGIVQGHSHGTLTPLGREQIRKLALELKDEPIDYVFSSDLRRAALTARGIAKYHKKAIRYLEELRERHPGRLHRITREEFFRVERESGRKKSEFKPEGGENFADLEKRIRKFCRRLEGRKYRNKTVLVVAHGWVVKAFLAIYMHVPADRAVQLETKNAGVLIIDVSPSGNSIVKDGMFMHKGIGARPESTDN